MKFGNRENECITTEDGRRIFVSRSPAVIATVIASKWSSPGERYVLVNRRSDTCPDYQGMLNMPCGYLDWDECGGDAAVREVYEECGLNLRELSLAIDVRMIDFGMLSDEPWRVVTRPKDDDRQNVLFYYGFRFNCEELPQLGGPNQEVSEVLWMPVNEALATEMAFDHHHRLRDYIRTIRP